jgi:hypothetical protein
MPFHYIYKTSSRLLRTKFLDFMPHHPSSGKTTDVSIFLIFVSRKHHPSHTKIDFLHSACLIVTSTNLALTIFIISVMSCVGNDICNSKFSICAIGGRLALRTLVCYTTFATLVVKAVSNCIKIPGDIPIGGSMSTLCQTIIFYGR